jgi:hypothetical protein
VIRVPHSSGRYPRPRWKMKLRVTQLTRRGERVTTFERDYESSGKTKRTGLWRVIHWWQRHYKRRIGRSTVVEVLNIRRVR